MTRAISPQQETRLTDLTRDLNLVLGIPAAMFGGEEGREQQLERIALDIKSVFSGPPVTFSNDAPQADRAEVDRLLSLTPLGRDVLRERGQDPAMFSRDASQADEAMVNRYLSATPIGREVLKEKGIAPTAGAVTSLDVLRAQGKVERPEVIDRMLAGSPAGRQVLADRAKKARS